MIRVQKYAENPKIPNIFLFLDILVPKLNKIKAAKPMETSSPFNFQARGICWLEYNVLVVARAIGALVVARASGARVVTRASSVLVVAGGTSSRVAAAVRSAA